MGKTTHNTKTRVIQKEKTQKNESMVPHNAPATNLGIRTCVRIATTSAATRTFTTRKCKHNACFHIVKHTAPEFRLNFKHFCTTSTLFMVEKGTNRTIQGQRNTQRQDAKETAPSQTTRIGVGCRRVGSGWSGSRSTTTTAGAGGTRLKRVSIFTGTGQIHRGPGIGRQRSGGTGGGAYESLRDLSG